MTLRGAKAMFLTAPCTHRQIVHPLDISRASDHVHWLDPCDACEQVWGFRIVVGTDASIRESWHVRSGASR